MGFREGTLEALVSFWRDRPVAVTGATGFLGSHLTRLLADAGAQVVVLVRDDVAPTPVVDEWKPVSRVEGDVRDAALMERLLGEYEVASVFHLAAQTQVAVANRNPGSTFDSNVRGTWTVLDACRRSPLVQQVVVASSDKAYGTQGVLPYNEEMPLAAVNPYDLSKACADMISMSFHQVFGVPVSITRCGNFFGPGDTNWARVVPGSIRSLLRGESPEVRSDGTPVRDYLHVEDGAQAYLRLAEEMATNPAVVGRAFNFSVERPLSVLDVVGLVAAACGRPDIAPRVLGTAANEIQDQYLSSARARGELGWAPRYTMEEALTQTVDWYRRYLDGA